MNTSIPEGIPVLMGRGLYCVSSLEQGGAALLGVTWA